MLRGDFFDISHDLSLSGVAAACPAVELYQNTKTLVQQYSVVLKRMTEVHIQGILFSYMCMLLL